MDQKIFRLKEIIIIEILKYIAITLLPWIELRGAIPLAVKNNAYYAIPVIVLTNIFIFFPVYFGLELFYELVKNNSLLAKRLEKTRAKAKPYVEKYGVLGLLVFVAIPLPGTGAYSGSLAAWLLDLEWKRSFIAVGLGVVAAGLIVFLLSAGLLAGLKFLT